MKQRVVGKQMNCGHCMVCGLENEFGLKANGGSGYRTTTRKR